MTPRPRQPLTRSLRRRLGVLAAVAALAVPRLVQAANCSVSTTPLAFGAYNVYATLPTDSMGMVQWKCSQLSSPATLTLNQGTGNAFNPRSMASGPNRLYYNLFLDAARTTIWGDGTGGTSTYTIDPADRRDSTELYGRIFALQDAAVGTYADTVTVVIIF